MSKTRILDDLLTEAVQDLAAAARLTVKRLPPIAAKAQDEALQALFERVIAGAGGQVTGLETTGRGEGGPANLWMDGILDDAKRDARSNAKGAVRDTALIGAVRKGQAATIVSFDTAIALAQGDAALASTLEALRTRACALNDELADALARITRPGDQL
jgi:ferritin-like metal-binding protein YciE